LKPIEFLFSTIGAVGSEITRRSFGKGPVSNPAPRA
ncbi:squalene synthase HpnC, partial [Rhodopseudomonas palustris]|nr:squalene synthase HpnC [Rhodopseudomonas palustris]